MTSLVSLFPVAGVAFAFRQSNLAGKAIVVLLLLGSVFAWSIMLAKMRELRTARSTSQRFLSAFRREAHPIGLYVKRQRFESSPFYAVYDRVCVALGAAFESRGSNPDDLFLGGVGLTEHRLSDLQMSAVRGVAERAVADQALLLENSMGFLATSVTTAPFLGLLGTVWGVMDSFAGMAVTGSAMLSAVAPGISGALLTTVIGLLVAMPSAIGYNMLSDRIRRMTVEMETFSQELVSRVERQYMMQN